MRRPLLLIGVVFAVVPALADVPDHLKCYKVKDTLAKAKYTADLGGLVAEPGCVIKTPANMLCVETAKTNVTPVPPGAAPGSAAGTFACYKVKCGGKRAKLPVTIDDQFGSRTAEANAPKLLCAPANVAQTTSTTSTTSTTAPPEPTTTTTVSTTTSTTEPVGCCYIFNSSGRCLICTPRTPSSCTAQMGDIPVWDPSACQCGGCGL